MTCSVFVSLFLSRFRFLLVSFFFLSFILFFKPGALRLTIGSVAGYRILDKGRREMESSERDSRK